MQLLTLLSRQSRVSVERAAFESVVFHHAEHVGAFERALRSEPWAALVLDPTLVGQADAYAPLMSYVREARLGLLLLAATGHEGLRAISLCAHHATPHTGIDVVLIDADRDVHLLATKLRALRERSVLNRLLAAVAPRLVPLPGALGDQVVHLFGRLPLPRTAEAFAAELPMVRRSVDRDLRRAGLRAAARCIETVRLAWAWDFLRASETESHDRVADECGYASAQSMRDHAHDVLHVPPTVLARSSPSEQPLVVDRLISHALR
jgi:hypothetical protein